jgi:hypothetical protein
MKKLKNLSKIIFIAVTVFTVSCSREKENAVPGMNEQHPSGGDPQRAIPMYVYGVWHAGNDYCSWATVRNMTDFDTQNHWLIDRGNGSPSVNLVVLSFVNPLKLLNQTTDAGNLNGIPRGMTASVVNYFTSHGVRVMLSIGGITYTADWTQALTNNATQLGLNAAQVATALGVGIEIDYEENVTPNLTGLQAFITAYRSQLPYNASGTNPAARLTIDLGAGDRFLTAICTKATADWLNTTNPVLDYANAMVSGTKNGSASATQGDWQEHVDGKPQYAPPVLPLAPAKFTGSLFLVGNHVIPECNNFNGSLEKTLGNYVQSVTPNGAGTSGGMLGFMFWAAECSATNRVCTTSSNSCQSGVGAGATFYNIPVPMVALPQQ